LIHPLKKQKYPNLFKVGVSITTKPLDIILKLFFTQILLQKGKRFFQLSLLDSNLDFINTSDIVTKE